MAPILGYPSEVLRSSEAAVAGIGSYAPNGTISDRRGLRKASSSAASPLRTDRRCLVFGSVGRMAPSARSREQVQWRVFPFAAGSQPQNSTGPDGSLCGGGVQQPEHSDPDTHSVGLRDSRSTLKAMVRFSFPRARTAVVRPSFHRRWLPRSGQSARLHLPAIPGRGGDADGIIALPNGDAALDEGPARIGIGSPRGGFVDSSGTWKARRIAIGQES